MALQQEEILQKRYKAVVIGGSAGSFNVLVNILSRLPENFSLPIIICCHRLKHVRSGFIEALQIKSKLRISEPDDKDPIRKGEVYVAPANYHMSVEVGNYFSLSTEEMQNNSRPAIDITFETCSYVYRNKVIGILLTGANKDGAKGMKSIKDHGGITVVQDPKECTIDTMPKAAIAATEIDLILKVDEIIAFLNQLHQ